MNKKKHVYIYGGLGNQMFQYAFYLSLKKKGIPCVLDASMFLVNKSHNGFELFDVFGIKEDYFCAPSWLGKGYLIYQKLFIPKSSFFQEKMFSYCADVYKSACRYYSGCWLSEDYFKFFSDEIRSIYQFTGVDENAQEASVEMASDNTVSIHVRRGDYLRYPRYCVCDEQYYKDAIDLIKIKVGNPFFFVFSDDTAWASQMMENFNLRYKVIDFNKGNRSFQDMYLMSQCRHHIIANSTFSWWGAWLDPRPDKIVIAPSTWFNIRQVRIDCDGWHIINVDRKKEEI